MTLCRKYRWRNWNYHRWCFFTRLPRSNRTNWSPSSIFKEFAVYHHKSLQYFFITETTPSWLIKPGVENPSKTRSEVVRKGKRFRFMCALQARKAFDWKFNDERNWNAKRGESRMSLQDRWAGNSREAENISSSIRTSLVAKVFPFLSAVNFESFWQLEILRRDNAKASSINDVGKEWWDF